MTVLSQIETTLKYTHIRTQSIRSEANHLLYNHQDSSTQFIVYIIIIRLNLFAWFWNKHSEHNQARTQVLNLDVPQPFWTLVGIGSKQGLIFNDQALEERVPPTEALRAAFWRRQSCICKNDMGRDSKGWIEWRNRVDA